MKNLILFFLKWSDGVCLLENNWKTVLEKILEEIMQKPEESFGNEKYELLANDYLFQYQKQKVLLDDIDKHKVTQWNKILREVKRWRKRRQY